MASQIQNSFLPVVIPAYQPGQKLVDTVTALVQKGFPEIYVVDDGSDSRSDHIFQALKGFSQVCLLKNAVNLGKGAALKNAFNYILVTKPDTVGVITVDADGQHHPDDVQNISKDFLKNPDCLVLGSRKFKGEIPFRSRFGNIVTGKVFHLLVGKKLADTQTGLRAIPKRMMEKLLPLTSNRYEFELDMLLLGTQGSKIREIPIKTIYEDGNKSSHFNPLIDSLRIYFVLLRFTMSSLLAYASDLMMFSAVYYFTEAMLGSIIAGRLTGLFLGTVVSRSFVFKSRKAFSEIFIKMFTLWLFLFGVSYGLMLLMVDQFGMNVYLSRILIDSALFIVNFLIQRSFIFQNPQEREE